MPNQIRYGLSSCYYSTITIATDGSITFGTPVAMPGAKSLKADPKGDTNELYADNKLFFVKASNNGYDVELELTETPETFRKTCLGEVLDAHDVLVEKDNVEIPHFALFWQFEGDLKATRHCMPYSIASRLSEEGQTTEDKIDFGSSTIKCTGQPINNVVKYRTCADTDADIYANWFTAPTFPVFPDMTVSPEEATYADADVVLAVTGGVIDTLKIGGATVSSDNYTVVTTSSGCTLTIKSTYLAMLATGHKYFKLMSGTKYVIFELDIEEAA